MEESTEDSAPKSPSRELDRGGCYRVTPAPESNEVVERATDVVPSPAKNWLTDELFVKETKLPRHKVLMKHLKRRGLLHESAAMHIIVKVTEVLRKEPNVITVAEPVTICGDVHGKFYNLPKIFKKGGNPSKTNYLFLGNYVNRGNFGIEVLLYLWSLKLNHPETFFMLRGNHECRHLAECFTFQKECRLKYSDKVYEACIEAFNCLPLAAVVNKQLFCVHGGLSPDISTIEDISKIDRFVEPFLEGPLCDLLWSDPTRDYEDETKTDQYFFPNEMRGCSYYYGYNAVFEFLQRNGLQGMVRAHEVQEKGYKEYRPVDDFPSLLTVFSTPDYLDYHTNKGCVSVYDRKRFVHRQFARVPDPNVPTTQSPVTSIPDHINKLTDAQLDLMNFGLNEYNNSTLGNTGYSLLFCCTFSTKYEDELLGDEKSKETIRTTLNATWIKFLAIREQMKSSLREHYLNHSEARAISENATSANAVKSCQPNFEMAKDMNAEDERKRLRREEPSEVRFPVKNWLTVKQLYDRENKFPRLEVLKDHFKRRGLLEESAALRIIREVTEVLREEPNVITVAEPVAICGDVHGQFYNLLEILDLGAQIEEDPEGSIPKETNFLFLGNYVNRGNFGIEVLLYLWCLKLNYPERYFMLRGNHDCRHLTKRFTFQKECRLKYSDKVYKACIEAFKCLPLAAVVNRQFFCVHGGLSPYIATFKDIFKIDRFVEPFLEGPLCDLLWSDPTRDYEDETKKDQHFFPNTMRKCSYYYGYDAVFKFLQRNGLQGMVRAHEVQEQGYKEYRPVVDRSPSLLTVFSTPDYLDYHTNKGCVSVYHRKKFDHRQFDRVPHPYELPQQSAPIASIPRYVDMLTDAQLDLMNFGLNEYNNSTLDNEKSNESIRNTLNATWTMFLAIREQLKSVLKLHYERRYTFDIDLEQRSPTSEQAEDLNAEDEQLLSFERAKEPSEEEKTDALDAEMESLESGAVSPKSREE